VLSCRTLVSGETSLFELVIRQNQQQMGRILDRPG
jgi:hypothetical protein